MSFSQPEPNTLYISLTFLSKDPRKNYYVSNGLRVFKSRLIRDSKHWTLYATGNNPPEGTKFHATDHGNSKNPLKYEDGRVVNPLRSKNLVVCLKVGYADSHQAIRQSLKKVPLGSSRALPRRESRWSCLVFLLQGLKQLNDDGLIFLPPDLDLAGIEAACYKHADYYYRIKEQDRNSSTPPEVINNNLWLQMENSPSRAGQPSNYYQTYAQPSHQGTVRMDTDRSYRGPTHYPTDPMETETAGRYLGPSPMETEPHGYYSHYRSGSRY
ncbi:hypothetical protein FVER53590_08505 [Fusarium verticillioides]|nr:hypothetical protein FVER53590_08505 [Fusarium verticillioides]